MARTALRASGGGSKGPDSDPVLPRAALLRLILNSAGAQRALNGRGQPTVLADSRKALDLKESRQARRAQPLEYRRRSEGAFQAGDARLGESSNLTISNSAGGRQADRRRREGGNVR